MADKEYSFRIFEALLTYAVDENSDNLSKDNLSELGFNEEMFFENIYIQREPKEKELEIELLRDSCHTYFIGQPGSGKTTIIRKVLKKIERENKSLIFNLDFKKISKINSESNALFQNMSQSIMDELKSKIHVYIIENNVDVKKIILFIESQKDYLSSTFFDNPVFTEKLKYLHDIFNFKNRGDLKFSEWLYSEFYNVNSDQIQNAFLEISESLEPHNYLYYFANHKDEKKICIISFDNVDSILNIDVRNSFLKVFREAFNVFKNSTRFIVSIRTSNLANYSDSGTYVYNVVSLNYGEFVNEELIQKELLEHTSGEREYTKEEELHFRLKHTKSAKQKFAKQIYERRILFFKNGLAKLQLSIAGVDNSQLINLDSIKQLEEYFNTILDDNRLRIAFFDLCNYDRRLMLVEIANFIHYLIFDVKLSEQELELNKEQINFILESFFYGWIKKTNKFYEDEIYNLPRDVSKWNDHNHNNIGCTLDHMIFCCVYNLSNQTYQDFNFDQGAKVKDVIFHLNLLGYTDEVIRSRILYLFKDQNTDFYKGLLELSLSMENEINILNNKDYEIFLTPRSYYLTLYSSLKFVSILSDIRGEENKILSNKGLIDMNDDKKPVTKIKLERVLFFLCQLANMNIIGLRDIGKKLFPIYQDEWFTNYRKTYCLKPNIGTPYQDSFGDLLFNNIISSHIKFLNTNRDIEISMYNTILYCTDETINEYKKLSKLFQIEVKKLAAQPIEYRFPGPFERKLNFGIFKKK